MNRKLYSKISAKWKGQVYSTYDRVAPRLKAIEPYLKLLTGKQVLEWGCNAGLFAYEISKYAACYTGVDKSEYCYKQALRTKKFIENPNVRFLFGRARDFCDVEYNAFISCYLLYHLHDDELELLRTQVLPKCSVTINMIRTRKREAHNELWKLDEAVKFIKGCGFETETKIHNDKYSTIIGIRNDNQG